MVIIGFEPLDDLAYVDGGITVEERRNVETLINQELQQSGQTTLHPRVDEILPLSHSGISPSPMLHQEIERYEEEEEVPENGEMIRGVDMSRYSEFDNDGIQYDNLHTTLSYSLLQSRNLALHEQNHHQLAGLQNSHVEAVGELDEQYSEQLRQKRQRIDDVNVIRKKRQVVDFKPVNDYLNDRWKDGIKSVVDLGMEATIKDVELLKRG